VTFSGGGGSGAAAYATVGGAPLLKGLNTFNLATNSGVHLQLLDGGLPNNNYFRLQGGSTVYAGSAGSDTNVGLILYSRGTGNIDLATNSGTGQLRVAHTASAVNYVQVTGAATTASPVVSAQGSDANITMRLASKGTNPVAISTNYAGSGTGNTQVLVTHTPSAVNFFEVTGGSTTNYPLLTAQGSDTNVGMILRMKGAPTGPGFRVENNNGANVCFAVTVSNSSVVNHPRAEPSSTGVATGFTAQGSDTNIDLALTPKGTGNVRFGTYTGTVLTPTGYVEIKDSSGTVRRLLVG
jgi:hypothetical protein